MDAQNTQSPLDRAISLVGSQEAFAAKVGVSQQAVSKWQRKGRIPADYVVLAELATNKAVKRHELRPDIFQAPT